MKLKFDFLAKCLLLMLLALGLGSSAMAQRSITGTVTDAETGDPLIGANVLVIGTSTGTVTDIDGKFTVQVPTDAKELEITYTGFAAQRVTLGASNIINISLSAGALLDEVVVIGYGSVKRSDLTGSIVSVGQKDFLQGLVTTPDQLIQGKAAGLQIINNSGQPGGETTVRIRGNTSIRAGNNPLYVVDGIQLTGESSKPGTNTGALGNSPVSNPLNYLNPGDIESIQVLKDASATAIYGSRGANGVILINTKKGRSGEPTIEFSPSIGISTILNKYDVLSGDEYRAALTDYGITGGNFGKSTDAMDEILQTAVTHKHALSVSGGSEAGSYRVALSYLNQEGILKNNDIQRLTAYISGDYKFFDSKRLGLNFTLLTTAGDENAPSVSTNAGFQGSLVGNALQWNPTHELYNPDGSPIITDPDLGNTTVNPMALLDAYNDNAKTTDILASIAPYFKLTDNLTYKLSYAVTQGSGERRAEIKSWLNIDGIQGQGIAAYNTKRVSNSILTHTLNYDDKISSAVNLNAVIGYEYQKKKLSEFGTFALGFINDDVDYTTILANSAQGTRNYETSTPPTEELQSVFGRVNFNISDKYLLTASMRADGSSKFGEDNRYGYFPAFAAAWNLHNEDFLSSGTFDELKLRAGWGKTGNQSFDAGASLERWGFGQGTLFRENVPNPELKWETTTNINVALDFAVMDYRLTGTVEYFNKETSDLLTQQSVIAPGPASTLLWKNINGTVLNKGFEATINANLVNTENLSWDFGVNATFLTNELQDYDGVNFTYGTLFGQGISNARSMRLENGQPLNAFYLAEFVKIGGPGDVDSEGRSLEGQSVYANNGAPAYLGDPNPNVLLGITTALNAGDLTFSMSFNGAMGHQIYNNTKNSVIPIGNLGTRNIDASLLDSPNQESGSNPIAPSSRYLEDADYVKLANATVSYNLGNLGRVKDAQVYITGNNLLVFTGYSGFDPEVNTVNAEDGLPSTGIEYIPYPSARSFMLGARFSF